MAPQVLSVNRKKYAVGLFWQPMGQVAQPRNFAHSLAHEIGGRMNLFVGFRNMVGLGARRLGHRSGMLSIAADVAAAFHEYQSFLAIFLHNNVYVMVAVRNGIIMSDKVFYDEATARREYTTLSEMPDWALFVAPAAWAAPRAVERNLSDVLYGVSGGVLRYISRVRTVLLSVLIFSLFCFGVYSLFRESVVQVISPRPQIAKINPELAAEYKRQIEEKNKELDAQYDIEKNIPQPLVYPYDDLPDVQARAEMCYRGMGFLMQPIPGWIQTRVECAENTVVAEFRRDYGTLGDFYTIASGLMPGAIVQERGDSSLTVRASLPKLKTLSSQDERDVDTIVRDVATIFQGLNVVPDVSVVTDTLTNGVETANLNIVEIGAESKMVPMQFMEIFGDFGGVYMTHASWNAINRTWNYEVIIYAK